MTQPPLWLQEFRSRVGDDGIRLILERLRDGRADMVIARFQREAGGHVLETRVDPPALVARRRR